MASIITDNNQVKQLEAQFQSKLKKVLPDKYRRTVSFRPDSIPMDVHFHSEYGIWFGSKKNHNRSWNAFGIAEASQDISLHITVEVNFPFDNPNGSIAGVFLKDGKDIIVGHRGNIGGGKKGMGKTTFFEQFSGEVIDADLDGTLVPIAVVAQLNSPYFLGQMAVFVSEVRRIKAGEPTKPRLAAIGKSLKGFDESFGKSTGHRSSIYTINRIHGIVVNELKKELGKKAYDVGNDRNRDIIATKGSKTTLLFEIKTAVTMPDVYKALGQLLLYSIPLPPHTALIMVLPGDLPDEAVARKMDSLGIRLISYQWKNNQPVFNSLDKALNH